MLDGTLIQLMILFLLFYFFLIRPELKKAKKHQEMLDALKKGDTVLTRGGLYAKIVKIENENNFTAEIADGIVVKLNKIGVLNPVEDNAVQASAEPKPAKAKASAKSSTKSKTTKTKK